MYNALLPGQTIGIIGGGQLGQMMTASAKELGFKVGVLDPSKHCPAAQMADFHILAAYDDVHALKKLATQSDVLTYEFENVDVDALVAVQELIAIPQGTDLLAITQDRLLEKSFLEEHKIVIAPYATIVSPTDIQEAIDGIGYPCVLKTTRGGYDGKGQLVLKEPADVKQAMELLRQGTCVLEAYIPYEKEISVIISGNGEGDLTLFPLAENEHRENILFETIVPARVDEEVREEAQRIAKRIARAINLAGTLAVELFLTADGNLYVNELAPRPHNSGHFSIEACSFSQFDLHIRGIAGWPLPETVRLFSPAVMVNILGEQQAASFELIEQKPDWAFHYYGKEVAKKGRKMGHITILTDDLSRSLEEIKQTNLWN